MKHTHHTGLYGLTVQYCTVVPLTRADWEDAAYEALVEGGPDKVAVASLAVTLGATRGSFYHHFRSRQELLDAGLARWERTSTEDLITQAEATDDPRDRLALIVDRGFPTGPRTAMLELRLAAAIGESSVQAALCRVHHGRVDYLTSCFEQLGWESEDATSRAWLAHLCHQGSLHAAASRGATRADNLVRVGSLLKSLIVQSPSPEI